MKHGFAGRLQRGKKRRAQRLRLFLTALSAIEDRDFGIWGNADKARLGLQRNALSEDGGKFAGSLGYRDNGSAIGDVEDGANAIVEKDKISGSEAAGQCQSQNWLGRTKAQ